MELGMRLNPHCPPSYHSDLAEALFVARRYEDMLKLSDQFAEQSLRAPAWKAAAWGYVGETDQARILAERFVKQVRDQWAGNGVAGAEDCVCWLLQFSPFAEDTDYEHFIEGLRQAGLPTP
jgi:hypothetical protein